MFNRFVFRRSHLARGLLALPLFLCSLANAAWAQTGSNLPLITLVPPPKPQSLAFGVASSSENTPGLQVIQFPATAAGSNASGATQTVQLRLNSTLAITGFSIPPSQGNKQEFSVAGVSGCNADGTYTNLTGTVCSITIRFTPAYPGQRNVPLYVNTNDGVIALGMTGMGVAPLAVFSPGIISTIAGNGREGYSGDGGLATQAELSPDAVAVDAAGNLYIGDNDNYVVRRVDAITGIISTIAGNGTFDDTGDGGLATKAAVGAPTALAIDANGNLYISCISTINPVDYKTVIRKLDLATNIITTYAGNLNANGLGDRGPATKAGIGADVSGLAFDSAGNLYIADYDYGRVRKVASKTGIITTIAGGGNSGNPGDGGPATNASLTPVAVAVDAAGNIYISDDWNSVVRKVDANTGLISTIAGNGQSGFSGDGGPAINATLGLYLGGLELDPAGDLFLVDQSNNVVWKIDAKSGFISTAVGNGHAGYSGDNGTANKATLNLPLAIALDSTANLYIADSSNAAVRRVLVTQSELVFPTPTIAGTTDSSDGPQKLTLLNAGTTPLTISVPVTGNNPFISTPEFQFNSSSTCPLLAPGQGAGVLNSGDSCILAVDFVPTQSGNLSASLVLTDDSGNSPGAEQTVSLSGIGLRSNADATSTTLTIAAGPYVVGFPITLAAKVADTQDATKTPTGTVVFSVSDGQGTSTSSAVVNGVATFSYTPAETGTFAVTATFNSSDFAGSSDKSGQSITVGGDFTISTNPDTAVTSITASLSGASPYFMVGLVPDGGTHVSISGASYPGTVTFAISGLPSGATATFSPVSLAQNAGTQEVKVTLNLAGVTARNDRPSPFHQVPVSIAGLLVAGAAIRRRSLRRMILGLAFVIASTSLLTGCMQSTKPVLTSSYNVVVTATSGPAQHSTSIRLNLEK